jgi:biotin carboxylase
VVEESPSAFVDAQMRGELLGAAVRLCSAARYRSAGTVEFLVDAESKQFFFLEVNARLQVEHGITELVSGTDIVEWMLRLQLPVRCKAECCMHVMHAACRHAGAHALATHNMLVIAASVLECSGECAPRHPSVL